MDIFILIRLFGGLAMFLYGMRLMGEALRESSSGALKALMEKVTNNIFKAFLLGVIVTALIQSSKATIVITAGLVAAGILTLKQSLGIIIGANVGTTVTGQIIRLLDLNAESGSLLQLFQPSTLAPIAFIVGMVIIMTNRLKNAKTVGSILIGFGILFTGLMNMTNAVSGLVDSPLVEPLLVSLNNSPLIGALAGALIAIVLQSASAAVGILQAFSTAGFLTFSSIYAVIVGIFLGECMTTALVVSIGSTAEPKKVGFVNVLFNIFKSVISILGVLVVHNLGLIDHLWSNPVNSGVIANTNTIFNLASALLAFPFITLLERIANKYIKEKEDKSHSKYRDKLNALSPAFFNTPALALRSCYDLLLVIYKNARENVNRSLTLFSNYSDKTLKKVHDEEHDIDFLKDKVSKYIVELLPHIREEYHVSIIDQYHKMTTEFEHLGDIAIYISDTADALHDQGGSLSIVAKEELAILYKLINEVLDETELAFEKRDEEAAYRIEPLTIVVDDIIDALKSKHLKRMSKGECDNVNDTHYMNLLSQIKRAMDICSNIGFATLLRVKPELADKEHVYFKELKKGNDERFNEVYEGTKKKYFKELKALNN